MSKWIFGIHPVKEVLESGSMTCEKLIFKPSPNNNNLQAIVKLAQSKRIATKQTNSEQLDKTCNGANHQGVALLVAEYKYTDFNDFLSIIESKETKPDVLILDGVQDTHNLGALIRSCDAFGVGGIILPKDRSASVNQTVLKTSAGAAAYVPVIKVPNLVRAVESLKSVGYWVAGMDGDAKVSLYDADLTGPMAYVLGGEGSGMRRLVRKNCDMILSLPQKGRINSLNVSVAGGIVLAESFRQKNSKSM